ncbi:MAG TPA: multiheme c-type cytochrome [Acidobacteriota bacterium]|jgi:hypothetical protein
MILLPLLYLFFNFQTAGQNETSEKTDAAIAAVAACRPCHEEIVRRFVNTAHFNTSRPAAAYSVKGRFSDGHNILRTVKPETYFKMEQRDGAFYQTGYQRTEGGTQVRTEKFDLVMGSGRKGQSYLFWKNSLLFQLPVSYLTGINDWVNSPGYVDGEVQFDRIIPPRCLECHATNFTLESTAGRVKYASEYLLGISCEKCHGPGARHVQYQTDNPQETSAKYILNPGSFSRARRIDNCALCHSGIGQPRRPSFSYKPGENLEKYFAPQSQANARPDVHGNQVALLRLSKCFASSSDLTCSTCHDVHREQRSTTELSQRCARCHQPDKCGMFIKLGKQIAENCIDCHLPNQPSRLITIMRPWGNYAPSYRNHLIGIYPAETAKFLQRLKENRR